MARKPGHQCGCHVCRDGSDPEVVRDHQQLNTLLYRMEEHQRRWTVAREAMKLGHGGIKHFALVTGLHPETISRGRDELNNHLADCPDGRIRRPGGGRPLAEKKIRL